MNHRFITLAPSIMCADIAALRNSIKELENIGIKTLHVDVIDGAFSPSMPLGVDTVKKIRDLTNLDLDVHIMSLNNEYFINEMLQIGVQSISFHIETSLHIDRHINLIKKHKVKAGVALNPATSLSVLDYVLPSCDHVLLMLINPGFATDKNEQQVAYAAQKVSDLKKRINNKCLDTQIQVDGRVSLEKIPALIQSGADSLVLGSTSLYIPGKTLLENKMALDDIISNALA
ncbi:ribulose-phosphate 3-epimerase [Orbus sturtevantii]|uniref:ribulose-phosphate 3-epimerase n=1 Tax=Orbus sturtevantii TaxID=3074109 RepID=UPI00370D643B